MKIHKVILYIIPFFIINTIQTFAGPPFRTDDPIPVPYLYGELYLFSTGVFDKVGTSEIGPAVEFNFGVFPNTQFLVVAPLAFSVQSRNLHMPVMVIPRLVLNSVLFNKQAYCRILPPFPF